MPTRSRTIRLPVDLDAEIERRADAANRSYANVVVTLLQTQLKLSPRSGPSPEPRPVPKELPKIAPRHWG